MTATRRVLERAGITAIACVLAACLAISLITPGARAKRNTPRPRVLVVSVNLFETGNRDRRHLGDMLNFVDRTLFKMDFAPDVLLLQEVVHRSVAAIRKRFTNKTGDRYVIVKDAGRHPWSRTSPHRVVGMDTAIIINHKTMRRTGKGGYFKFGYKRSQAKRGSDVKVKKHAFVPLARRNTQIEMPAVSLHYPKEREFRSNRTSRILKKKWSKAIANRLNNRFPANGDGKHMKVIAGDFNNFRCRSGGTGLHCRETPAYHLLTHRPFNYKDAIVAAGKHGNPIDFIFTTRAVCRAGWDKYQPRKAGSNGYYSNHDFRWALLEGKPATCH
jgi:hypothetical protein